MTNTDPFAKMSILYMNKLTASDAGDYECRIITGNERETLKFEVKYENGSFLFLFTFQRGQRL